VLKTIDKSLIGEDIQGEDIQGEDIQGEDIQGEDIQGWWCGPSPSTEEKRKTLTTSAQRSIE